MKYQQLIIPTLEKFLHPDTQTQPSQPQTQKILENQRINPSNPKL